MNTLTLEINKYYLCKYTPDNTIYVFKYLGEDNWSNGYLPGAAVIAMVNGWYDSLEWSTSSSTVEVISGYIPGEINIPVQPRKPMRCLN